MGAVALLPFLTRTAPPHLVPLLPTILERGGIWLNDRRVFDPAHPLEAGETVTLCAPINARFIDLLIEPSHLLFEDDHLVALQKAADWYSQGPAWDAFAGADAALRRFLTERDGKPPDLHLFHRLDRGTSGILLFTKNPRANAPLQKAWPEVEKRYQAIALGLVPAELEVTEPVQGKRSHTRITPIRPLQTATWVEARPFTGRTHQIRRHLAHVGHPLVGDERYGGGSGTFHLHAGHLAFSHPLLGHRLELNAPLPRSFETALGRL